AAPPPPFLFAPVALRCRQPALPRRSAMKTLKTLALIGLLAILGAIAAAVFFFGGYYNVAASVEDPGIVNRALIHIRQASIARHATEAPPMSLDDPAVGQAGGGALSPSAAASTATAPRA